MRCAVATESAVPILSVHQRSDGWLFAATAFLASSLLFIVQPLVAKQLLPLLGGAPAVWATCVLYFQTTLAVGYAWAHFGPRLLGDRTHARAHAVLLALGLAWLPIGVGGAVSTGAGPAADVLVTLLVSIGLPVTLLAASSPLLQRWHAPVAGQGTYKLYAIGNLASLLVLLAYPFLIEPLTRLETQRWAWSAAFAVLTCLVIACALRAGLPARATTVRRDLPIIGWTRRGWWLLLSAAPSMLLVGTTTHLTTDVAAVPLLWVVPLSAYLLAFTLAFAGRSLGGLPRRIVLPAAVLAAVLASSTLLPLPTAAGMLVHVVALLLGCWGCLDNLYRDRPAEARLTDFYLCIAIGGAIGGALATLVAPLIFTAAVEYLVALALVLGLAMVTPRRRSALAQLLLGGLILLTVLACGLIGVIGAGTTGAVHAERSFFGIHRVKLDTERQVAFLLHGSIVHGMQSIDPSGRPDQPTSPLSYYHRQGPLGDVMSLRPGGRVAAIGMGVASIAAYATDQQPITFFEIDPVVIRIAQSSGYFSFLSDAADRGARVEIIEGDARITLARQPQAVFDLVVVDAFSGDSIPVHLLTREAIQLYLSRANPEGVVAIHVSNRHLDLAPVVARIARDLGAQCVQRFDVEVPDGCERSPSQWVVVSYSKPAVAPLATMGWNQPTRLGQLWTDDFSNLLLAFKTGP